MAKNGNSHKKGKLLTVPSFLSAIVLLGAFIMQNQQRQTSSYYAPASSNAFIPLALAYSCVCHTWSFFNKNIFARIWNDRRLPPHVTPLPDPSQMEPKIAIVTGSNTGIGYETARRLVQDYGWEVILACRSKDKASTAMEKINNNNINNKRGGKAVVLDSVLDLSDFQSIRQYTKEINDKYDHIDVLINNAGRNTSGKSKDGLDLMMQSNYLGHFLLTYLLLDKLRKTKEETTTSSQRRRRPGKIINLSSVMHHFSKTQQTEFDIESKEYWKSRSMYSPNAPPGIYSASKLAAILHSLELNRRYEGEMYSLAVNPGGVYSDIWRGYPELLKRIFELVYLSSEQGSTPIVAAAVRDDWREQSTIYLQPLWVPPQIDLLSLFRKQRRRQNSSPMIPFTEMLGVFVGYSVTTPRLPSDGGMKAAQTLWEVSEELVKLASS
jgi:NAD(P)-dependent dehydrogenase (short-subunit alcohol dehydrogenase family)